MELDMNMTGPVQLLPTLPASSTRQLVRRRTGHAAESPSIQRCRSTITAHAPATQSASTGKRSRLSPPSSGNVAVVRPGSNDNRVRQDRKNPRESAVRPPRQVLSARVLAHSNPYMVKQPPKERRSGTQRARNQQHPTVATSRSAFDPPAPRRAAPLPPASQMRPSLRSVRAKVDSHLCPHLSNRQRSAPKQPQPAQPSSQRTCQSTKGKSLAAAHQQLELMLSRIERVTDYQPPPPPPAAQFKRRGSGVKVAKGVSRQMAHPPPVPAGTPMLSARKNKNSAMRTDGGGGAEWQEDRNGDGEGDGDGDGEGDHIDNAIPLVQNPQCLPPAKRDALMKLLQRTEQHDKGIVDMMGTTGDSRDAMLMLLQMMPLSLEDSPYKKKLVDVHRHPKERQKQQKLRPVDKGFKELKELHGPDGQERYHNVRNALEHRSDPHPLSERQEQAMLEREQLERDKQLVINCREKRRLKEQIGEQTPPQDSNQSKNPTTPPKSTDPWKQVLQDRDRFQANCNRSCFYNNSQSSAPWKIYAKVASKLSSQLIESVDVEFHRSVINYINDIVGHKVN